MAIVDATRELEPREAAGIGWDGKRLDEMLATSERLFAETGSYYGLTGELALKDSEPIELREALQPPARRPRLGARDGAQHLRLADRPRARRALLRALHARGRLDRPLDRDHRPRPHDVGRDQVHGPKRVGGQPEDPSRRHLRQQRPGDRRRPQRRRADLRPDLLGGRAGRLGRRGHPRARHRRLDPGRGPGGADEPARRRHRPPVHEDRRGRRARRSGT